VDDRRRRQEQLPDALRQREGREFTLTSGLVRDHARCRAPQYDRGPGDAAELDRGVDRVVARVALLFIGGLLLLVDHDEADAFERREERGARADDDIGDSIEDAPPLVETLARGQGAVQERNA